MKSIADYIVFVIWHNERYFAREICCGRSKGAAFGDNKKENTSIDQITLVTRRRSKADWKCETVNIVYIHYPNLSILFYPCCGLMVATLNEFKWPHYNETFPPVTRGQTIITTKELRHPVIGDRQQTGQRPRQGDLLLLAKLQDDSRPELMVLTLHPRFNPCLSVKEMIVYGTLRLGRVVWYLRRKSTKTGS